MIRVVTTFSRKQWEDYAHILLPKSIELWPKEVEWQVWLDDESYRCIGVPSVDDLVPFDGVCYLSQDKDHETFMAKWNAIVAAKGQPQSYLFDAGRFSHKVFAMTSQAAKEGADWLIFLGADVETFKPITLDWLSNILVGDLIHLGRTDIRSSETDFLAVKMSHFGENFLDSLRHIYTSGDLYYWGEWIDGHVIGRLASVFEGMGADITNLSKGIRGLDVFEKSVLGETMIHHKGPGGKEKLVAKLNGA